MLSDPTGGAGIAFGQTVTHGQFTSIFAQIVYALDGHAGGTYNPSSNLTIGGNGLHLTTPGTFDEWVGNFVNCASLQATGSTLHDVAIDGTFTITGTATFSGHIVEIQHGMHWGGSGTLDIERPVTISGSTTFNCDAAATFGGSVAVEGELDLSTSLGRVRERVTYASDADATLTYGIVGQIHIFPTSMTAARTIKLANAPSEGCRLRLVNLHPTYAHVIQNAGGGSILLAPGPLPVVSGVTGAPGVMDLVWANAGAYTGWVQIGS